jgi:predicted DNA-binding protein
MACNHPRMAPTDKPMTKRTLWLPDESWEAMTAIAKETGAPIAWQIRSAIDAYLETKKKSSGKRK